MPIVAVLTDVYQERLGRAPKLEGMGGWTDCALLKGAGIPGLLFGPTGAGLHSECEYVDIASVELVADILAETAFRFCATS